MAVFFSLANGVGRIAWGTLSDSLGRKRSVVLMAASQGVFLFAFIPMAGTESSLYVAATLIGFNFGGNFALFPALIADEFGNSAVGRNYPWVFLSYGRRHHLPDPGWLARGHRQLRARVFDLWGGL